MGIEQILDFSPPSESVSNSELDLHLDNAIQSFKEGKRKMNKKTNLALILFGIGFAIFIGLIHSDSIKVPQTNLALDTKIALPVFLLLGSITYFGRTLDMISVLFARNKVKLYYKARFKSEIDTSILTSPSSINLMNWAIHAGWLGKLMVFVPILLGSIAMVVIGEASIDKLFNIGDDGLKLMGIAIAVNIISTVMELCAVWIVKYLVKNRYHRK